MLDDELAKAFGLLLRRPLSASDGTLFDAMRHATWTTGAPEHLVPFEDGCAVEPKWELGEGQAYSVVTALPPETT
ncbi:hypothetical protein AB0J72_13690 [Dactylosporangium sp. NPDC049742]|uniref:hypothetical protein n=1 Tax=Dactylosporangium sp. NPDC049742 TaxID=3154737 RepID=UPI0034453E22